MLRYIVQRIVQLVPILIGISVLTFLMLHLIPGDPVLLFAGDKPLTEERAAEIRHEAPPEGAPGLTPGLTGMLGPDETAPASTAVIAPAAE